jgi:hypothetical protein
MARLEANSISDAKMFWSMHSAWRDKWMFGTKHRSGEVQVRRKGRKKMRSHRTAKQD